MEQKQEALLTISFHIVYKEWPHIINLTEVTLARIFYSPSWKFWIDEE